MMNLEIQLAKYEEKHLLQNMLELLVYDLSEFEDRDLNEFGKYGYRYLDLYWIEPERFPFILRVNEKLAGFALVNGVAYTKDLLRNRH
jgi:predicted acetyltransferase